MMNKRSIRMELRRLMIWLM